MALVLHVGSLCKSFFFSFLFVFLFFHSLLQSSLLLEFSILLIFYSILLIFYSFNFLLSSPFSFSVSFLSRLSSFLILFYFINVSFVPLIGHNQKNLLRARPSENNESLKFIFSSKYHQVPGIMICQRSKRK